ncbi:uncharacterized protein BT62DRAFT_930905 [Guyanagaster necrorhizus]|uniref:Uncharacterized protein n=1 Tax=Guyanagaster necrorhizus TaxID=856835 RepID=A0A9P7VWS1_9AGAR|nr:uncharacterized protein BT62DRAFT_930905 [Guyanagaster necrorhizus MCA 3950]KAG7447870.1 hypothetical protein BT62DRAFT_930905 [Guyanagaster necrorhizus MCA 3950]
MKRWSLTRQQELLTGEGGGEASKPGIGGQERLTVRKWSSSHLGMRDESGNGEEIPGADVSHESASAETWH